MPQTPLHLNLKFHFNRNTKHDLGYSANAGVAAKTRFSSSITSLPAFTTAPGKTVPRGD
jgi:hypothetical protein